MIVVEGERTDYVVLFFPQALTSTLQPLDRKNIAWLPSEPLTSDSSGREHDSRVWTVLARTIFFGGLLERSYGR